MSEAFDRALTVDNDTQASLPGGLEISVFRYIGSYPLWPILWALPVIAGLLLAVVQSWWFLALALLGLAMNWLYYKRLREHFRFGCVNPAVVVDAGRNLVAVYTDLANTPGVEAHVIKILRQPLGRIVAGVKEGQRLGTVALYEGSGEDGKWSDFHPKVVDCAATDEFAIAQLVARLDNQQWQMLSAGLNKVPTPYQPGLYPFEVAS